MIKAAAKRAILALRERLRTRSGTHDVLFLCQNGLMADYLGPIWEILRDEERLRFFVTFPRDARIAHEVEKILRQLPVEAIRMGAAECRPWDLIVTADHGYAKLATRKRCPVIYTGHGMTGKVVEGEGADYSYGPRAKLSDGTPRYSAMLEASHANRDRIQAHDPMLAQTMQVVGSLQDDRLLARQEERDAMRAELGFAAQDRVVLIQSSWGRDSLVHTVGDTLLASAQESKSSRFILSVHPHEYRPTEDGSPSWGARVRALGEEGFVVREPGQDWIPYLLASDLVISDHTSLVIYGALIAKPTLWVPVPEACIQAGTALARLRALSPVYAPGQDLEAQIEQTLRNYPHADVEALAHEINAEPGQARTRIRALVGELLGIPDLAEEASPRMTAAPQPEQMLQV